MSVADTIFKGLASKDCENTTTELLVNLMRYKYLRDIILNFLLGNDYDSLKDNISADAILTQRCYVIKECSYIPDIVINARDCFVIIENKVRKNCPLEEGQCDGYKIIRDKYGKEKSVNKCVFLLPDEYAFGENFTDSDKKYWSELLEILLKAQVKETSSIVSQAIDYFISVIDIDVGKIKNENNKISLYEAAFQYKKIDLSNEYSKLEEQYKEVIELRNKLVEKIEDNYSLYKVEGDGETTFNPYQFGAYIKVKKSESDNYSHNLWIGCTIQNDTIKRQLAIKQDGITSESLCRYFPELVDGWYHFDFKADSEKSILNESLDILKKCYTLLNN